MDIEKSQLLLLSHPPPIENALLLCMHESPISTYYIIGSHTPKAHKKKLAKNF